MSTVTVCVTGDTFTVVVRDPGGTQTDSDSADVDGGTASVNAGGTSVEVEISGDDAVFTIDGSSSSVPLKVDDDNECASLGVT